MDLGWLRATGAPSSPCIQTPASLLGPGCQPLDSLLWCPVHVCPAQAA